jgi:hypothetical protein
MPHVGLADWMKIPEAQRKEEEGKLKALWDTWAQEHSASIRETAGAGSPSRVTSTGAQEEHNDVMMYSIVTAESKEAATAMFIGHPHLQIPGAWIDIMPAKML